MGHENEINNADVTDGAIIVSGNAPSARSKLHQLIESKKEKDGSSTRAVSPNPSQPKIQRILPILVSDKTHLVFYQPKWISIGPIHHGEKNLKPAERYKLEFASNFIENSGHDSEEVLYNVIEERVGDLKMCFDEEVIECDDEALAWMLFLDGCFILQFIYSIFGDGEFEISNLKPDQIAFVLHDLFLLENQIPFEVLNLLITSSSNVAFRMKLKKSIWKFIHASVMIPQKKITDKPDLKEHVHHLLDFLRLELIHQSDDHESTPHQKNFFSFLTKFHKPQTGENNTIPIRDDKSSRGKVKKQQNQKLSSAATFRPEDDSKRQQFFRSVTDLKASGIYLKPSKSTSLQSINFSSKFFYAELELPALVVDDSTAPKFLNLIAYEMCPDNFNTKYEITSFISLLDSLIDYATDVKELRLAKILNNCLGSDKEVARLFNNIAKYLVPNSDVYLKVVNQIEKHYMNNVKVWIAQFLNEHFSSPWTLMAFLGAILIIILTLVQTWYTIYPPPNPCDNFCKKL